MNAKKKRDKFAREFCSDERIQHVKDLGCLVQMHGHTPGPCSDAIHNHHTQNGGMGRKGDFDTIVPLCVRHHREVHDKGVRTFEKTYGLDLALSADAVQISWVER